MAVPDDLQAAFTLGRESIDIAKCQDGVGLGVVLGNSGDTAAVVVGADLMAVPRSASVPGFPGQQLVVIEVDGVAAKAHSLQLKHVGMGEKIYHKRDVAGREILSKDTVVPSLNSARAGIMLCLPNVDRRDIRG